ncbi:uncharacterized protein LOC119079056 [Bradysia coprophila]|uniref:uncharacterized protein LOC119079056 n=1 Tax=Bradysia coprophila TaxID=38358 RepID=UPI00187D7ED3|nr:uncharacterized protein LOC119079056 [Bradysia coprophila]
MKSEKEKVKICLLDVMMITVALIATVGAHTTFTKEAPLLWARTGVLMGNSSEFTFTVRFQTPCRYFQEKEIYWCEREFDQRLFHQLERLCTEAAPLENRTEYRNFVRTVALEITSPHGNSDIDDGERRLSDLKRSIRLTELKIYPLDLEIMTGNTLLLGNNVTINDPLNEEIRTLKQFKENRANLRTIKRKMLDEAAYLNRAMTTNKDNAKWHKDMDPDIRDRIIETTNVASYFRTLETRMSVFSQNWRQGVLSDEFFDILMMARNDTVLDMYRGYKPKLCRFSKSAQLAVFHLEQSSVASHILEARPFRLHRQLLNTGNIEILTYQGPRNVFHSAEKNCTVLFDKDIGNMPTADDCHLVQKPQHSFEKFWTRSCSKETAVYGNDVQIQLMGDKFFIYCYGQDINFYNESLPCPNYVFSINVSDQFQISKFRSDGLLKDQGYKHHDLITVTVNQRVFPNASQMDFDIIPIAVDCPTKFTIYVWILLLIVVVIAAYFALATFVYLVLRFWAEARKGVTQLFNRFQKKETKIDALLREEVAKQRIVYRHK